VSIEYIRQIKYDVAKEEPDIVLPRLLEFKKCLKTLWEDGLVVVAIKLALNFIATVTFGVTSVFVAQDSWLLGLLWASAGVGYACEGCKALYKCAQVSDLCMSADGEGIHNALLEKGRTICDMSERQVLAFNEMQHIFQVCRMGARIYVFVDWTLLARVVATSMASLAPFVKIAFGL